MNSEFAMEIKDVSKQYRLGEVGTGTLSHDINRWFHMIRGKEDPYSKIGDLNDRTIKSESDYVWALKDVNFEVRSGEVLGIIGRNGAGKSTLLKVLAKVTGPTTGLIKMRGRIASLLEVGTGMHPDLTGRENVYLNGAILGMTRQEVNKKIDEIIDFSGCSKYIDTPIKRYSSGMKVRLGFAVAAFLEPEILIVDEVLAVGDADFQKKAIGKMQDVTKDKSRTVLFVSHNMASIKNLCSRVIVMENGTIVFDGDSNAGISYYLNKSSNRLNKIYPIQILNGYIEEFRILNYDNIEAGLMLGESCSFELLLNVNNPQTVKINVRIQIFDNEYNIITTLNTFHSNANKVLFTNKQQFICYIPKLLISPGNYFIGIKILDIHTKFVMFENECFADLVIESGDVFGTGKLPGGKNLGVFLTDQIWTVK